MNKLAETKAVTLTGAEAVAETLKAHDVEILFGMCGDTGLPLMDIVCQPLYKGQVLVSEWIA